MDSKELDTLARAFKGDVSAAALEAWLAQFEPADLPYIVPLVKAFRYYSLEDVFSLLNLLFRKLRTEHDLDPQRTWFVPCGYVAKSGDAIAYFFKRQNRLPDSSFLRGGDLSQQRLIEKPTVVFLDDFIGSGQLLLRTATEIAGPLNSTVSDARFIFAALVGYVRGIRRVQSSEVLRVCVAEPLGEESEPFDSRSQIFPDISLRQKAETAVRRYTERLSPKSPLGYGSSQGLVAFFFGTPNNTLPIFWRAASDWQPLLPHGDALHDPERIIEIPGNLASSTTGASPSAPLIDELDISEEATNALADGFQILRCMEVAARLVKRVGFKDSAIQALVRAIRLLQEDVREKKPVCPALLCVTADRIARIKQDAFLIFDPPICLTDAQLLRTAAQLVDGFDGALLVDPDGQVHAAVVYPGGAASRDPFLPSRYLKVAAATRDADGFAVLFAGAGRVTILDRDTRVLTRRFGKWHPQGVPTRLRTIEAEHGLDQASLDHAMRTAFALADAGWGAILTLGDEARVASFAGKRPPPSFRWGEIAATQAEMLPFLFSARQDGATVLDKAGVLHTAMTILDLPAEATADDEVGKNARHSTAAKVSSVCGALAIAVSEDGTITLYSKGRRIFRVMG